MKLTKGKINKLYKKKKQSLKKIKNKNKNKSKRHTFRKHKKMNLARKSLKKFRGGADDDGKLITPIAKASPVSNAIPITNAKNVNPESNRETAVIVVDEIYKGMHDNDRQDSSKAVKLFSNKMVETLPSDKPSDIPQITNDGTS